MAWQTDDSDAFGLPKRREIPLNATSQAATKSTAVREAQTTEKEPPMQAFQPKDSLDLTSEAAGAFHGIGVVSGESMRQMAVLIETIHVQLVVLALIFGDVLCGAMSVYLHLMLELGPSISVGGSTAATSTTTTTTAATTSAESTNVSASSAIGTHKSTKLMLVVLRILESVSGFTICLFVLEMVVLMLVFRRQFFTHWGYLLDLVVTTCTITGEVYFETKAFRLLGLLRGWRAFRLVLHLVQAEQVKHRQLQRSLAQEKARFAHLMVEKQAADAMLQREYESHASLERLLQRYKDEIDTLKEALEIAAQAVAEATYEPGTTYDQVMGFDQAAIASRWAKEHTEQQEEAQQQQQLLLQQEVAETDPEPVGSVDVFSKSQTIDEGAFDDPHDEVFVDTVTN